MFGWSCAEARTATWSCDTQIQNPNSREADGATHWRWIRQKLKFTHEARKRHPSLTEIGSIISGRAAARHDFSIAKIIVSLYCTFEFFEDTGRNLIEPKLMGHVAIPSKWKQFLFHRGSSFNLKSILEAGHIAGGKRNPRRTTNCVHHSLDPWRNAIEEHIQGDMSKPRKVHHKTEWKRAQENRALGPSARAQENGITFW